MINKEAEFSAKCNLQKFAETPCGGDIISTCVHKGILIVATTKRVYQVDSRGVLTAIMFENEDK